MIIRPIYLTITVCLGVISSLASLSYGMKPSKELNEGSFHFKSEGYNPGTIRLPECLEGARTNAWSPKLRFDPNTGRISAIVPEEVMQKLSPSPAQTSPELVDVGDLYLLDLRVPGK